MFLRVGHTGAVVQGTVFDTNKIYFDRALRSYDEFLYSVWNPAKNYGMGAWEIRRRPEQKTLIYKGDWEEKAIYQYEYFETDIINHVLDVDVLDNRALIKIKEMDVWARLQQEGMGINQAIDYYKKKHTEQVKAEARAESMYVAKQHKQEIRDMKELIRQGLNPGSIFRKMN